VKTNKLLFLSLPFWLGDKGVFFFFRRAAAAGGGRGEEREKRSGFLFPFSPADLGISSFFFFLSIEVSVS